jgi:mannose-6-phosphate isomerase-like protein (cupin superfamily)
MIKTSNQYTAETRYTMRGGNGEVHFEHIWKPGDEMKSKTRLYSKIILNPGSSIGYHIHENEEEFFYIISGEAIANDNGSTKTLSAGDSMITRSGEGHFIECSGSEPVVILAVISCY